MNNLAVCVVIAGLLLAFVWLRLDRSNMDVGENVENALSARDALRFGLDNDLPLRSGPEYIPGNV